MGFQEISSSVLFVGSALWLRLWLTTNQSKHRTDMDEIYLEQAHTLRLALDKPVQSQFRVVALLVLDDGRVIPGANDEPSPTIGGAICAERAALLHYRMAVVGDNNTTNNNDKNKKNLPKCKSIYIVTDSHKRLPPGLLCREYMYGHPAIDPHKTRIVMQSCHAGTAKWIVTLKDIYPFPPLYMRLSAREQVEYATQMRETYVQDPSVRLDDSQIDSDLSNDDVRALIQAARVAAEQDNRNHVHPIRYGAAVLLWSTSEKRTKKIESACQKKALEYGASQDAVCQLLPYLQGVAPEHVLAICMVDGISGMPQPPFAPARSLLAEHGYGKTPILLPVASSRATATSTLVIRWVRAMELAPFAPEIWSP